MSEAMIYEVYRVDGTARVVRTIGPAGLKQLQGLVGGMIQFVDSGEHTFCVNEEGLLLKLIPNPWFTQFVGDVVKGRMRRGSDGDVFEGIYPWEKWITE